MEIQVASSSCLPIRYTAVRQFTEKKGPPPAPLSPQVAKNLLDLLSTDNDFRRLFKKDAHAALVKAGWQIPAGRESNGATSGGFCMQLERGDRLASKAKIIRGRAKLETLLIGPPPFRFDFRNKFVA